MRALGARATTAMVPNGLQPEPQDVVIGSKSKPQARVLKVINIGDDHPEGNPKVSVPQN